MSKCRPQRDPFEIVINEKSRFVLTVSDRDTFDLKISDEKSSFEVCLPFKNPDNYLKYGTGESDMIKLGPGRSYIIYK